MPIHCLQVLETLCRVARDNISPSNRLHIDINLYWHWDEQSMAKYSILIRISVLQMHCVIFLQIEQAFVILEGSYQNAALTNNNGILCEQFWVFLSLILVFTAP